MERLTVEKALSMPLDEFQAFMNTEEGIGQVIELGAESSEVSARIDQVLDMEYQAMLPVQQERIIRLADRVKEKCLKAGQ